MTDGCMKSENDAKERSVFERMYNANVMHMCGKHFGSRHGFDMAVIYEPVDMQTTERAFRPLSRPTTRSSTLASLRSPRCSTRTRWA